MNYLFFFSFPFLFLFFLFSDLLSSFLSPSKKHLLRSLPIDYILQNVDEIEREENLKFTNGDTLLHCAGTLSLVLLCVLLCVRVNVWDVCGCMRVGVCLFISGCMWMYACGCMFVCLFVFICVCVICREYFISTFDLLDMVIKRLTSPSSHDLNTPLWNGSALRTHRGVLRFLNIWITIGFNDFLSGEIESNLLNLMKIFDINQMSHSDVHPLSDEPSGPLLFLLSSFFSNDKFSLLISHSHHLAICADWSPKVTPIETTKHLF